MATGTLNLLHGSKQLVAAAAARTQRQHGGICHRRQYQRVGKTLEWRRINDNVVITFGSNLHQGLHVL